MQDQTRQEDWPVHFADDAFNNSPGIIYVPVESAPELREASATLQEHFAMYGPAYGVAPGETDHT